MTDLPMVWATAEERAPLPADALLDGAVLWRPGGQGGRPGDRVPLALSARRRPLLLRLARQPRPQEPAAAHARCRRAARRPGS